MILHRTDSCEDFTVDFVWRFSIGTDKFSISVLSFHFRLLCGLSIEAYFGMKIRTSCPFSVSARGRKYITCERPPTVTNGATSAERNSIFTVILYHMSHIGLESVYTLDANEILVDGVTLLPASDTGTCDY